MNKPITMIIEETKAKLANICNESGLSPAILDLIMSGIYSEIHSLAERQASEERAAYIKMMADNDKVDENDSIFDNDEK